MLIPTALFILPAVFIIIAVPIVIRAMNPAWAGISSVEGRVCSG